MALTASCSCPTWLMMPVVRDMMTAHWQLEVAIAVTKNPSRHFFLIHSKGNESDTYPGRGKRNMLNNSCTLHHPGHRPRRARCTAVQEPAYSINKQADKSTLQGSQFPGNTL